MEGTVKWFNTRKGYGFIKGDDGEDYFIHHTAIDQGTFLRDDDRVSFEPVQTDRGKQAQKVTLLQKGSEIAKENKEEPQEEQAQEEESQEEEQEDKEDKEDKEEF